jgi:hypothetical protein
MEENVFPLPEIQKEFEKFVLVTLHVEDNNQFEIQEKLVNDSTLPAYVVLKPGSEKVVGFIGFPSNPMTRAADFAQFLKTSHEKALR